MVFIAILLYSNETPTQLRERKNRLSIFFMDNIIVTTPEQLQTIVGQAVEAIIPLLAEHQKQMCVRKPKENLSLTEAIEFLSELGFRTTRSTLYNLTFRNMIPYRKIGKRTVFSRQELLQWVEKKTLHVEDESAEMRQRIARSANRKLK